MQINTICEYIFKFYNKNANKNKQPFIESSYIKIKQTHMLGTNFRVK